MLYFFALLLEKFGLKVRFWHQTEFFIFCRHLQEELLVQIVFQHAAQHPDFPLYLRFCGTLAVRQSFAEHVHLANQLLPDAMVALG